MRIVATPPSGGKKPTTPTIGTATDGGTGTSVSVAFTPSTYIGKGTITYTATSSPGSLTGTGSGSPITVSGLTTGTAYTFTVAGATNYGVNSDASAASNSVTPASPSSFESIATITTTGVTNVTFSSIPQTYKNLQIRYRITTGAFASLLNAQFNGVTAAGNYRSHYLEGNAGTVTAGAYGGTSDILLTATFNTNGTYPSVGVIDIIDYTSTSKNKTIKNMYGYDNNTTTDGVIGLSSGVFLNTSAVSSIKIYTGSQNFTITSIALYGIKG